MRLMNAYIKLIEPRMASHQLDVIDWGMLSRVHFGSAVTVPEFEMFMGITRTSLHNHAEKLEGLGFINRVHTGSRRNPMVMEMTDKGREMIPVLLEVVNEVHSIMLAGVDGDDLEAFHRVTRAILDNSGHY